MKYKNAPIMIKANAMKIISKIMNIIPFLTSPLYIWPKPGKRKDNTKDKTGSLILVTFEVKPQ